MAARLEGIFVAIATPVADRDDKPVYAVMPVPGYESYFIGKDREGHACLLVSAAAHSVRMQSPIRLENLDVQFELRCHLRRGTEAERIGSFTVVRCRSLDTETVRYFLSICDIVMGAIGDRPKLGELASAVHRLAAIFQKMQRPPTRSVIGLFGELYLIRSCARPARALAAWRIDDAARFDFSEGDVRIEVKVTSGRLRSHVFSYEQCNPPPGTVAIVVSMFAERSPEGSTLRNLISEIESSIAAFPDLVLKLHDVISATLGSSLSEALTLAFDMRLAETTTKCFNLRDIPALRVNLPAGVSDVHFKSDLSAQTALDIQALETMDVSLVELLPQ
jgi:hypothetical protein